MSRFRTILIIFLVIIILISIALTIYYAHLFSQVIEPNSNAKQWTEINNDGKVAIPRQIWAFWDQDTLSETAKIVTNRWNRVLGDTWSVNILTPSNLSKFIDVTNVNFDRLSQQAKSDWIRLYLLNKYGGIWMDATILVNASVEFEKLWQTCNDNNAEMGGFYLENFQTNPNFPVIESWCIMAPPNSGFISKTLKQFEHAMDIGFYPYKRELNEKKIDLQKIFASEGDVYLTIHACMQYVLQTHPNMYNLQLWKAEDTMYRLHDICKWDVFCINFRKNSQDALKLPFIKLRGPDRLLVGLATFWSE